MNLKDVEALARRLMAEHGIETWDFLFDRSIRRFGCCHYDAKLITVSAKLSELNDEDNVRDTILHEIAHAKAPRGAGHNSLWRAIALALGCNGQRTYSSAKVVTIPKRYIGTCPQCGITTKKNRRTRSACGRCCREFNNSLFTSEFLFRWTDNNLG